MFTKVCGIKEGIPQFHGAPLQLLGEALCGGTSAIRVHLQQRQGPGRERSAEFIHCPGGVQRRPAGHAQGKASFTIWKPTVLM